MEDSVGLYGTPEYLEGRAADELTLIAWDTTHAHLPEAAFLASLEHRGPVLRFRRMTTMVEAARHGAGVAFIGALLAHELGFVPAPIETPPVRTQLWLAAPKAMRETPAVAALWDWFEELGAEAAAIEL